jgi:hypothetical protein
MNPDLAYRWNARELVNISLAEAADHSDLQDK